jgi:hypothetical protein
MRARALLYASLALVAPFPAFALGFVPGGNSAPAGLSEQRGNAAPAGLSVQASLDSCGVYESQIVCMIDTSFSQVEGADYYTASVSRPDGSVADFGPVSPGGTNLWVPYVGNGTYTVEVSAYGDEPKPNKPEEPIEVAKAKTGGEAKEGAITSASEADDAAEPGNDDPTSDNGTEPPPSCDEATLPPADPTDPGEPGEPPPPGDGSDVSSSGDSGAGDESDADPAAVLEPTSDAAAPEDEAQLPESVSGGACSPEEQP